MLKTLFPTLSDSYSLLIISSQALCGCYGSIAMYVLFVALSVLKHWKQAISHSKDDTFVQIGLYFQIWNVKFMH